MTAMIRNLAKMTSIGLIAPFSEANKKVIAMLGNEEVIKKARIHPFSVLLALRTYGMGQGVRGSLTWTPEQQIMRPCITIHVNCKHPCPSMNCNASIAGDR